MLAYLRESWRSTPEIARQEAINLASTPATTGQDIDTGTTNLAATGGGGGGVVIQNIVTDQSTNSASTNLQTSGRTTNADATAGRVANNVE